VRNQRDQKQDQEDEEHDLRETGECYSDSAKADGASYDRNDEKHQCPIKHFKFSLAGFPADPQRRSKLKVPHLKEFHPGTSLTTQLDPKPRDKEKAPRGSTGLVEGGAVYFFPGSSTINQRA
jgi:hypothetical protein